MGRSLSRSERLILYTIFKSTLPYDRIFCDINSHNMGGVDNSITPTGTPYFSINAYYDDFSGDNVPVKAKWVFFHELTHVWQYYHRINVLTSAIGVAILHPGDYGSGYPYSLGSSSDFMSFNIEQQASIVADYWIISQSGPPRYNQNPDATLSSYQGCIAQLQQSGPPHIPSNDDYDGILDGRSPLQRSTF